MKKYIIILSIILLILITSSIIFMCKSDKELLILQDNVKLKVDPDNQKIVKILQKLEKVKLVSNNPCKEYIQVKTGNGKIGWVLEKYTTYITDKWKEHKIDSTVRIMLPKDQQFTFLEKYEYPELEVYDKSKKITEWKLYNQNYFIINTHSEISLQNVLRDEMGSSTGHNTKPIFKKILYNKFTLYFADNLINKAESYGSPVYLLCFGGNKNDNYSIGIILHGEDKSEDYYLTARKILLTVKRK